ncbi:hypothetical protein HGRIS_011142 [Hohenbuehelia grisea]|uniref:Uncharacterized protein n=1 Tax=Hohenbuehelia grisea TaxID=104357 RepID=A0ABR3IZD2_9AGAR
MPTNSSDALEVSDLFSSLTSLESNELRDDDTHSSEAATGASTDHDEVTPSMTMHEYLISFKAQRVSQIFNTQPSSRPPRLVELAVNPTDRLEELVHFPSLVDHAHQIVGEQVFRDFTLSRQQLRDLESGPHALSLNNPSIRCEGDVQHNYRGIFAFSVALVLNIMDAAKNISVCEGTIVSKNQNIPSSQHATADLLFRPDMIPVEIKKPAALGLATLNTVFPTMSPWDQDPKIPGGIFHFVWPGPADTLSPNLHGILQGYCQLIENARTFGIL